MGSMLAIDVVNVSVWWIVGCLNGKSGELWRYGRLDFYDNVSDD